MQIIPLSEGSFTIDKTKLFVPFDEGKDNLQSRPVGSLLVEIQPFVVITSKDMLLLDTGLGFDSKQGAPQIHENLIQAGIQPERITKVLMSHLHKDHAGGVTIEHAHDQLSFPNAMYYVQEAELEEALKPDSLSYINEDLFALRGSPRVQLLNGNGSIDGYIHYEVTGAHSPYHQVFRITENGHTIFFGGDDAPQLQQMKSRFVAKYDFDGKKAMELRKKWLEEGSREGWEFLFYHDIKSPVMRFQ